MKPSTLILLIFLTIVFLYVVVIFKTFTNTSNNVQNSAREISPPLDASIISELEKRIAYEHAKFLDVSEKFESVRLQMKSLITELESLHQHENQIISHSGHHEDGAATSTLLK